MPQVIASLTAHWIVTGVAAELRAEHYLQRN